MVTGVTAILTPALTALFVVALDQGIRGWFLASLITGIATFGVTMRVVPWHFGGGFRWPVIRTALLFSFPLVPHFLSHWALQLADRLVIAGMVSGADLGRYTLASILAGSVMMLMIALNQGFAPSYARAGATGGHAEALQRVVVVQITAVVAIALAGALIGPVLVEGLTPADYHGASDLVPWLMLGYGFLGLYFIPMNGATLAVGRTSYAWVATAVSAALNIGLLYLLVPDHGVQAAAVASAAGYLALLVLIAAWAHAGPNPVRYDWRRIVPAIAAAGLAYAGAQITAPDSLSGEVAVDLAWLLAFAGAVVALVFRAEAGQLAQPFSGWRLEPDVAAVREYVLLPNEGQGYRTVAGEDDADPAARDLGGGYRAEGRQIASDPVILNLGCGTRTSPEMVNIDWSITARIHQSRVGRLAAPVIFQGPRRERYDALSGHVVAHDLRKGIPFEADTADAVYHSHVLEHIDRDDVPGFMAEVWRVLKSGGIHRIVVPNLERMVARYLETLNTSSPDHDSSVEILYEQSVRKQATGTSHQPRWRRWSENLLLGDARRRGETHQWQYDHLNLATLLEEHGFTDIRRVDAHTSAIPGWAKLGLDTNPDGTEYKPSSLFMEARK